VPAVARAGRPAQCATELLEVVDARLLVVPTCALNELCEGVRSRLLNLPSLSNGCEQDVPEDEMRVFMVRRNSIEFSRVSRAAGVRVYVEAPAPAAVPLSSGSRSLWAPFVVALYPAINPPTACPPHHAAAARAISR
jgi:hypothetical protein